jgi:hypothetical protein
MNNYVAKFRRFYLSALFIWVERVVCPEVLALPTQWTAAAEWPAADEPSVAGGLDSLKATALQRQATRS